MQALEERYADLLYQQYEAHIHGKDMNVELVDEMSKIEKELGTDVINKVSSECMEKFSKEHN